MRQEHNTGRHGDASLPVALLLAMLILAGSGCATGRHTVRVHSEPAGARLYQEGELLGTTPVSIPWRWYLVGMPWLETLPPVRLEMEGYETLETHLPLPFGQPDRWSDGSEFGWGRTAEVELKLKPLGQEQPAR